MEEIYYSDHLKLRLKLREIPKNLPMEILEKAEEIYLDTKTSKLIALKKELYKGKEREFAVTYEKIFKGVRIITIHPLKPYQKIHRIKSGRWTKWKKK